MVFTRKAVEDYERILDWYLLVAPHEVERLAASFNTAVELIGERPLLPKVAYRDLRNTKTKAFPYHLWYRVFEEIELVEVLAVLHGAQDWTRLGFPE